MLFKFIWVAITALALYGCPSDNEEDDDNGDNEKKVLSLDGGTATWNATDGVVLAGTVKEGDDEKSGVKVVFTVTCGEEDAAKVTATATSGDDGKVTAKIAAADVDGATDAASLKACKVTAKVGEGDAAVDAMIQAGTSAAADKLMGMVHELTWAANTTATVCTNAVIYKVAGATFTVVDQAALRAAQATAVNILVLPLPTATSANDCEIGDAVIKFSSNAHSATAATGCAVGTCFKATSASDHALTAWSSGDTQASGNIWIKKTTTGGKDSYVRHVAP